MSKRKISIPMIHLNGTGYDSLLADNASAQHAVMLAIESMNAASPHGRDYYPRGDEALPIAIKEHEARVRALQGVLKELVVIEDGIRFQVRR